MLPHYVFLESVFAVDAEVAVRALKQSGLATLRSHVARQALRPSVAAAALGAHELGGGLPSWLSGLGEGAGSAVLASPEGPHHAEHACTCSIKTSGQQSRQ